MSLIGGQLSVVRCPLSVVRGPWFVVCLGQRFRGSGSLDLSKDKARNTRTTDHGPRTTDYGLRTTDHGQGTSILWTPYLMTFVTDCECC